MKKLYIILLSLLPLATLNAQEMDPDCQLLFNPGKSNSELKIYSFAADAYESVLKPSTGGPVVDTVMKWQKAGGWGGLGAIYNDTTKLVDLSKYKYLTLWVMPTEEATEFIKAEYKNRYYTVSPKNVIGENRIYIDFAPNVWNKAKFDLEEALQFADLSDTNTFYMGNVNFQPDGTNDVPTWIGNYYYFGPVYLESETGCATISSNKEIEKIKKEYFTYFNNTISIIEPDIKNLSVYSILGAKIIDYNQPSGSLKISGTNKGAYLIHATTKNNEIIIKKILVK